MNTIWAINPLALKRLLSVDVKSAGPLPEGAGAPKSQRQKSVAVLPLYGPLESRLSFGGWIMGGTSTVAFGRAFDAAVEDETVGAILLDVDSPGGSVLGTQELADKVYAARGTKPIVSVANHQADSAAYWIASAADGLYVSPSGRVGSVGTMATVQDWSKAYEEAGVKEYLIASDDSPHKGEWLESQPVSEDYLADIKAMVNEYQRSFVSSVARNRGVGMDDVRSKYGKGRDVGAKYAVENGMADGIATFDAVLSKMIDGRMRIKRAANSLRQMKLDAIRD